MTYVLLIFSLFCHSPVFADDDKIFILKYDDFGPQIVSHELIGFSWWQWDAHGDSNPQTQYDVKVVVYKNISLAKVKKAYPVIKEKSQDYRYVEYAVALKYFDKVIKNFEASQFFSQLINLKITKSKIIAALNHE